ncbi:MULTISPECIES: hypothetical protein [unclassified Paenibacillus]|uniref:hypothetical protein n=1 Tax=unclassified Paenibacillus TaxID=185978 RepID=UPI000839477C|nr:MULTISPECIES: hypothetical protein [unclassified Paenibacillus]
MWQKKARYSFYLLGTILMLFVITGCGSSEPSWTTFVGASVEKSFPVPKEANRVETAPNNSKMDYAHYSLSGLNEDKGVPEAYQKIIKEWGWMEKAEESKGTTTVYEKDKLTVQLTIYNNSFTVLVPKRESRAVVQGLDSGS